MRSSRALDGEPVEFKLVRNPAESIKPELVEQGLLVLATYIDVAAKVLGDEINEFGDMLDADEMPTMLAVTDLSARVYRKMKTAQNYVFPPVVKIKSVKEGADEDGADVAAVRSAHDPPGAVHLGREAAGPGRCDGRVPLESGSRRRMGSRVEGRHGGGG